MNAVKNRSEAELAEGKSRKAGTKVEDLSIAELLLPCCYRRLLHHRFEYHDGLS